MARVVVLGGSGFLGRHVCQVAEQAGHQVYSLSRREGCDLMNLNQFVTTLTCLQPDAVINCAAHVGSLHYVTRRAADVAHDNLQLLVNTYRGLWLACPRAMLVNPISNCSYPGEAEIQRESEWWQGPVHDSVLAYGTTRRMFHTLAACYWRQYAVKSVNWIIANAYGPGDALDADRVHALNGIVLRLIRAQQAGLRTLEIWGTGKPVREWCYIEDAARILVESLGMAAQVEPINVAQHKGYSIAEIARIAATILDYDVEFCLNPHYPDGAPVKILDARRFRAVRPDFVFTPLEDGIRRTIEDYRNRLCRQGAAV